MTLSIIKAFGKMDYQTVQEKLITITETFIKVTFLTDKDKDTDHTCLTNFTSMKENGEITLFVGRESYSETGSCFSKETFRMD